MSELCSLAASHRGRPFVRSLVVVVAAAAVVAVLFFDADRTSKTLERVPSAGAAFFADIETGFESIRRGATLRCIDEEAERSEETSPARSDSSFEDSATANFDPKSLAVSLLH